MNPAEQDERFKTLMQLAKDGVDEAIGDLWSEFGFDFRSGRYSEGRGLDLEDQTDLEKGDGVEGGVG